MTDLVLSTGTNLGDRERYLEEALKDLCSQFDHIQSSRIYESSAVDYEDQPDFLNQVHHFLLDKKTSADEVLKIINEIENTHGRKRLINKGPRTLDIDILFYGLETLESPNLIIPHPRQFQRSFIVTPLRELDYFETLKMKFDFPTSFDNSCWLLGNR